MFIPILISCAASTSFAITNHIDKYLISRAVKNADYRALIVISTVIAGAIMSIVYMFICNFQFTFDLPAIALLLLNSALYVISLIFYFKGLSRDDPTIIVVMFQLIPVFMLFLSPLFLENQTITPWQLFGGFLVTLAALFITYEPSKRRFSKKRLVTLAMMTFVSLVYAVWYIIERYVNETHDFNQTIMWSNITMFIVGVFIVIFLTTYRKSFNKMIRTNGAKVMGMNFINEILNSVGGILSTLAGTMASVALVSFVSQSVQQFAVMIIGVLIAKLFPKTHKEKLPRGDFIKRIIAIIICIIGLGFIEFG